MAKKIRQDAEVRIKGSSAGLAGPMNSATNLLSGFATAGLNPVTLAATAAAAAVVGIAVGIKKTVDAVVTITKETAAYGDELAKTATRLNTTAEKLDQMRFAVERSGGQANSYTTSIKTLARTQVEAAEGVATYTDVYDGLGVSVTNADGSLRDANDVFLDVAEAVANAENHTEALGLAQQILGRGAIDLLPLMKEGKEGIEGLMAEAVELGGVMSNDLAKASEEHEDAVTNQKLAMAGLKNMLAAEFMPILTSAITRFTGMIQTLNQSEGLKTIVGWVAKIAGAATSIAITATEGAVQVAQAVAGHENADAAAKQMEESVDRQIEAVQSVFGDGGTYSEAVAEYEERAEAAAAATAAIAEATQALVEIGEPPFPDIPLPEDIDAASESYAEYLRLRMESGTLPSAEGEAALRGLEEDENAGLPNPETMDLVSEKWGSLTEATATHGQAVVNNTLAINSALRSVEATANEVFVTRFSANLSRMGNLLTRSFVQNASNLKNFKQAASQIWKSFVTETIIMLVKLIAKLMLAAALQAFLGFGNFTAIGNIAKITGLITGGIGEGKQYGGVVRGRGSGDRVLTPTEPGEGILTRAATAMIGGPRMISHLNALASPVSTEPQMMLGGGGGGFVVIHASTVFGGQEEGDDLVERIARRLEMAGTIS